MTYHQWMICEDPTQMLRYALGEDPATARNLKEPFFPEVALARKLHQIHAAVTADFHTVFHTVAAVARVLESVFRRCPQHDTANAVTVRDVLGYFWRVCKRRK